MSEEHREAGTRSALLGVFRRVDGAEVGGRSIFLTFLQREAMSSQAPCRMFGINPYATSSVAFLHSIQERKDLAREATIVDGNVLPLKLQGGYPC